MFAARRRSSRQPVRLPYSLAAPSLHPVSAALVIAALAASHVPCLGVVVERVPPRSDTPSQVVDVHASTQSRAGCRCSSVRKLAGRCCCSSIGGSTCRGNETTLAPKSASTSRSCCAATPVETATVRNPEDDGGRRSSRVTECRTESGSAGSTAPNHGLSSNCDCSGPETWLVGVDPRLDSPRAEVSTPEALHTPLVLDDESATPRDLPPATPPPETLSA